jgi:hypothetical protein
VAQLTCVDMRLTVLLCARLERSRQSGDGGGGASLHAAVAERSGCVPRGGPSRARQQSVRDPIVHAPPADCRARLGLSLHLVEALPAGHRRCRCATHNGKGERQTVLKVSTRAVQSYCIY